MCPHAALPATTTPAGIINDVDSTIDSIIAASELPLSILIVGVGAADFTQMEALDGDKKRLARAGRVARRDIVQFVALRDFMQNGALTLDSGAAVSRALLSEIPQQLLEFMEGAHILPNPRPVAPPLVAYPPPAGAGMAAVVPPPPQAVYPAPGGGVVPQAAYPPMAAPADVHVHVAHGGSSV